MIRHLLLVRRPWPILERQQQKRTDHDLATVRVTTYKRSELAVDEDAISACRPRVGVYRRSTTQRHSLRSSEPLEKRHANHGEDTFGFWCR